MDGRHGPDVRLYALTVLWLVTVLWLAISAGCAPVVPHTLPDRPALLAAVTWNMDAGRGDLARLVADLERGRLGIQSPGAYLLLLQESATGEFEDIARPRHWATCFAPVRATGGQVRGNAIVFSRSLRNCRVVPLPRERQSRAAAVASIDLAGQELFAASTHLENRVAWWKGGLFSDSARQHQVEALLHAIPQRAPGILGGDFNTWLGPNEAAWRILVERFHNTREWSGPPTFADRLVLDHLFMDLPDGWRMARWVVRDNYGSDHQPVIAVIFGPA